MDWTYKILEIIDDKDKVLIRFSLNSDASEIGEASIPELEDSMTILDLGMFVYQQCITGDFIKTSGVERTNFRGKIVRIDNRFMDRVDFWISLDDQISETKLMTRPALAPDETIGQLQEWALNICNAVKPLEEVVE